MPPLLTFSELLASHVAMRPNAIAFIEQDREIQFSDFDRLCRQTASWLSAQGIGQGDRIAVWLVNRIEWLALVFAAARIFDHVADPRSLPSIRTLGFSSFSYSAEEFALPARERGFPLAGLYGSSEVQALFAMQPTTLPPEQQIQGGGRPASGEGAQVRIRDVDTFELLAPQACGEIEIRADTRFVGYFNDDEATRSAIDAEGSFRTGDIGYLRTDGTFVYQTRRGDAIRLAGFLVSPTEIETTLAACPGVAVAQVVAARIDGQVRCVAFVLAQAGTALTEAEVTAHAAGCMTAFKVPARVWVVDDFPTTQGANGTKIQRAALRAMAEERLADAARLG